MYKPYGVGKASKILAKSSWFMIYYDPDIDGAVAGELVRRFLTAFGQKFTYHINDNRQHGLKLTDDQLKQLVGGTIILVDAAMTRAELEKLTAMGINCINIDHHHVNEDSFIHVVNEHTGCEGVVINNQYPFEPEDQRYLSGAGVVYYVLNAISPGFCEKDEKALVGLTLLSDIRPLENEYARDFLYTTFTHKSPMMQYLVDVATPEKDFGFGVQTFDRNFIDFTFSPRVNALFRLNKGNEAIALFQGKFDSSNNLDVYRRIQNAVVDTIIEHLEGDELTNLVFKSVPSNLPMSYNYDITNFIGLACSRIKNYGKTTLLLVRDGDTVKRASVRGLCDDVDYLSIFRKHGFQAEGHHNAFGVISVDFSTVDSLKLNNEIAEKEKGYEARKYAGRIMDVSNMSFFLQSKNSQLADHNNYVRDQQRVYLRYTGSNVERVQKGKAVDFILDGVKVTCFDPDLQLNEGLILPVREREKYIQFYLKRY